jgi:DNA-binding NtrC family response regulator
MPSFQDLAQVPLDRLVPELVRRFEKMSVDELTSTLNALEHPGSSSGTPSLDEIARMVIDLPKGAKLREVERVVLAHALETSRGNVSAAARLLGANRKAMERKLARYKLR